MRFPETPIMEQLFRLFDDLELKKLDFHFEDRHANSTLLYNNILRHDFTKYIPPSGTVAVDASVRDSAFKDQRFVAMKVKDAIVDQFREKFGERPSVDSLQFCDECRLRNL